MSDVREYAQSRLGVSQPRYEVPLSVTDQVPFHQGSLQHVRNDAGRRRGPRPAVLRRAPLRRSVSAPSSRGVMAPVQSGVQYGLGIK